MTMTESAAMSERDEAVENAVVALLNVAVVLGSSGGVEFECKLCGQREENHTVACPVPALEQWVNPTTLD